MTRIRLKDGEDRSTPSWIDRVLAKAGPRLCECPSRFFALQQLLQFDKKEEVVLASRRRRRREIESILGVSPFCADILFAIDVGLGLAGAPTHQLQDRTLNGEANPFLTTRKSVRDYATTSSSTQWHAGCMDLKAIIYQEFEQTCHGLDKKRDEIVSQNRARLNRRRSCTFPRPLAMTPASDSLGWQVLLTTSKPPLLARFVPFQSSTHETNNTLTILHPSSKPGLIPRIEHLPRYVTSVSVRINAKVNDDETFLTYVPAFASDFAPDKFSNLTRNILDLDVNFINDFNEEAKEEVMYQIVSQFGPLDATIGMLSRELNVPFRLVRKTCAEVSLNEAGLAQTFPFKTRDTEDADLLIDSYRTLFCPRCCVFDCRLHGVGKVCKRSRMHGQEAEDDDFLGTAAPNASRAMLSHCRRLFPSNASKQAQLLSLFEGLPVRKNVASAASSGVTEEKKRKQKNSGASVSSSYVAALAPPSKSRAKFVRWLDPCNHDGPCANNESCTCFTRGRVCERDCACDSASCGIMFGGCQCSSSSSSACCASRKECECKKRGRECLADLCGCAQKCCTNRYVQNENQVQLMIGFSGIHKGGWGSFAKSQIEKGQFIGEYCGEVISEHEADKRGFIYDNIVHVSFLFELCKGHVVDSYRRGTKTKWINYAPDEFSSSDDSSSSSSDSETSEDESMDDEEEWRKATYSKNKKRRKTKKKAQKKNVKTVVKKKAKVAAKEEMTTTTTIVVKNDDEEAEAGTTTHQGKFSNCRSSVVIVDGEPRILLFAKRRIEPGEELCFNYGKFLKLK